MYTLRQYLNALSEPQALLRTLDGVALCRDEAGRPCFTSGNSAAVFRIRHRGRVRALRCYYRPKPRLEAVYGTGYLPREIYLHTSPSTGVWVDAVLTDWIEGPTLRRAATGAARAGDRAQLAALADAFDRLAEGLLADDWAHGDLKPENIVVAADGALRLIDFDAIFLPAFAGEPSPELGTAAFQHPARTAADFDASLDDFPSALISTALHALALDPALYDRYGHRDGLLFEPRGIASDEALAESLALFEAQGDACAYRIARMLLSPTVRLFGLGELFRHAVRMQAAGREAEAAGTAGAADTGTTGAPGGEFLPADAPAHDRGTPGQEAAGSAEPRELFAEHGLWGYRVAGRTIIPPLYDEGFDFTEGLAAVRLHRTWHYIDPSGRIRLRCPGCEAVKPFRRGRAAVVRRGVRETIDRCGRKLDI